MNPLYISVLVGGLIGSTSTVVGAVLSHRFTRNRDRRTAALQGLRELAVVRIRMQRRDELEFEADLATVQYQWTVAGVSPNITSAYLRAARYGNMTSRVVGKLNDEYLKLLSQLDHLIEVELIRPSRGRKRIHRERIAVDLAGRASSIKDPERGELISEGRAVAGQGELADRVVCSTSTPSTGDGEAS